MRKIKIGCGVLLFAIEICLIVSLYMWLRANDKTYLKCYGYFNKAVQAKTTAETLAKVEQIRIQLDEIHVYGTKQGGKNMDEVEKRIEQLQSTLKQKVQNGEKISLEEKKELQDIQEIYNQIGSMMVWQKGMLPCFIFLYFYNIIVLAIIEFKSKRYSKT